MFFDDELQVFYPADLFPESQLPEDNDRLCFHRSLKMIRWRASILYSSLIIEAFSFKQKCIQSNEILILYFEGNWLTGGRWDSCSIVCMEVFVCMCF